ncbi:MAG TPA: hypothetical protein VG939_08830, partial [Caulobacteraceae bacterium]|nr:hypothetical protein [Caulobacteraceae bacterium]
MDTLAQLIDRREPVQADCPCETVLERFIRDPSAHALAVVDASGPVGVIPRDSFLARMEVPGSGELSARSVMSAPPALIASDLTVEAAVSRLLLDAPEALLCGFVAVDAAGRYEGVGTALGLLKGRARVQASEARAGLPLALVAAEAREPVNAALAAVERLRRFRLPDDALACLDTVAEAGAGVLSLLGAAAELDEVASGAPRFDLEA